MHSFPELRDQFGRRFEYLRLSITERCNFRCDYCLPNGYSGKESSPLSTSEIHSVVQAFVLCGTRKVRITGGEPGLRKDLGNIIHTCANIDGIDTVALTTNGYNLEKSLHHWIAAGLDQLNVSIDSLDSERFAQITGHNRLTSIRRGIDQALGQGLKVKVNAVLMKGFDNTELRSFLNWVRDSPITVRFIELMQTGNHEVFFSEHHIRGESIKSQLIQQGWKVKPRRSDAGPAIELDHVDYQGSIGFILPYSRDFCTNCNRLRVSSTGKLHLCLFGDQGYDIRPWMNEDAEEDLVRELHRLIVLKDESHYLDVGKTGATQHFAMLGG